MSSHGARIVTAYRRRLLATDASDTLPLPRTAQGLFITVAGNVRFKDASGYDTTAADALPVGLFPCQAIQIWTTGLTASGFVLYDKDVS